MGNYFVFHLHSMLSNPSTNIDSVTNFKSYVSEAKRLGMKGLCFSEHGNIFEFCHKKEEIEAAGMKYVHGMEAYLTDTLERGKRRAFHCILIARNYEGFLEINRLFTKSYNRNDGHFFYNPRITFDELEQTSDNIIVTSACLGGPLGKGEKEVQDRFLRFLVNNKDRSFLEIQHHNVAQQITYNQKLAQLSRDTGIKLIAGTDTHALNEEHMIGRKQLQVSKGVNFPDEDEWDLVFKSYDELLSAYELQNSLPYDVYMEAIQNTNILLDMCDSYALDTSKKYPKIYKDSVATFKQKINEGFEHNKYVKQHPKKEVIKRIREEEQVYEKVEAVDFMLLMCYLKEWQLKHGIYTGPGRGSVSGSEIAYVLGITEMDSIKFDLNFFRFLNPSRVTNSDIDLDFGDKDREKMKKFLLDDHMGLPNIQTAEIITFNTIKMKGAIKDIGRALQMPLKEVQDISNAVETDENQKQYINEKWRKKYPELFKYVDIVNGVITSIGTHPSGVLISDRDISSLIGLCSLSTTPYPVTALNMKELDALWFVKLDVLGLANVDLINQTCELAGIERLTPDNTDLDDMKVWESIREDTTGIFQWASDQASAFIKKFMSDKVIKIAKEHNPNFSMLKHFSFGNGLLRPACASFRDNVANGEFYTNGLQELDDFLATTFGHCSMQEDIMRFLVRFCGYSDGESDNVRRAIAKKKGTQQLLPEIEQRFIEYSSQTYGITKEKCAEVIKPFLQVIQDASNYGFSWNHSDAYSCIGYICGYLRYYYPYEFIATALNVFQDKPEIFSTFVDYANRHGMKIAPPRFRKSQYTYIYNKEDQTIEKGLGSIKYINKDCADSLYAIRHMQFNSFTDLLYYVTENTSIDKRQLETLIKCNYFDEFGKNGKLIELLERFKEKYKKTHTDKTKMKRLKELREYEGYIDDCRLPFCEQIETELDVLGYIAFRAPCNKRLFYVIDSNTKYTPILNIYSLSSGKTSRCKVEKKAYAKSKIKNGDILYVQEATKKPDYIKTETGFQKKGTFSTVLTKYRTITDEELDRILGRN